MNTIKIYHHSNYGKMSMYLADAKFSYLVRQLTGKITVDKNDLEALNKLLNTKSEIVSNPNYQ